jgi:hypothetical protein
VGATIERELHDAISSTHMEFGVLNPEEIYIMK